MKAKSSSTPKAPATKRSAAPASATEGRVNVYKVAEQAGVSPGTVSRVLNNRGRVHADTRQRVFEAARALGFRPQVQVRTKQVAVIGDNMWQAMRNWGYYQEVWSHLAFALYKQDMGMVLPDSPEDLREKHVDGILVIGEYPGVGPLLDELRQHTPIVLTDDLSVHAKDYWVVHSDQLAIGRLAAEQFAKGGRKRLGFVGSWGSQEHVILKGYRDAMSAAGLECQDDLFVLRTPDDTFYGAVSRVIRNGADALLIPGSNYESIEGMNIIANVLRLQVPQDVALIGGEIHGVCKFLTPPMTTIAQPLDAVATKAVDILAALMRGEQPPKHTALPVRLIARESA